MSWGACLREHLDWVEGLLVVAGAGARDLREGCDSEEGSVAEVREVLGDREEN